MPQAATNISNLAPARVVPPTWQVADLLLHYIAKLGCEYVFGVPGAAIEPLYNALARSARLKGVRAVVARHEAGAGFMADGYYRETGRLGVCCTTTGPGATNLLTSVACAYQNEIPMLVISAQSALPTFGKGALQESSCTGINTLAMFEPCTRYNTLVSHVDQLEHKLLVALRHAFGATPGPVHLSIPIDVLKGTVAPNNALLDPDTVRHAHTLLDEEAVKALWKAVKTAKCKALVIGPGCSAAAGIILEFAQSLGIEFVTTPDAKGLVSAQHPLYYGVFGFAGHPSATALLRRADLELVLAVGVRVGELASGGWDTTLLNDRLVHISQSQEHLAATPMARLQVCGSLPKIFERLLYLYQTGHSSPSSPMNPAPLPAVSPGSATQPHHRPGHLAMLEPKKYRDRSTPIKPQRLMYELGRRFPPTACYYADSGNSVSWVTHYLSPYDRRIAGRRPHQGGTIRVLMDFCPMGWAIGAAVGTALAERTRPVVCVTGDGSYLMSGQEITVAVAERLTVIFVILNDSELGMIKHGQRLNQAEPIGFELPPVDYAAMARAVGAQAHIIRSVEDFTALDIGAICSRAGPTLLDVRVDPEEAPPLGVRIKALRDHTLGAGA